MFKLTNESNNDKMVFTIPLLGKVVLWLLSIVFLVGSIYFYLKNSPMFYVPSVMLFIFFFMGSFYKLRLFFQNDFCRIVIIRSVLVPYTKHIFDVNQSHVKLATSTETVELTSGTFYKVQLVDSMKKVTIKDYDNENDALKLKASIEALMSKCK